MKTHFRAIQILTQEQRLQMKFRAAMAARARQNTPKEDVPAGSAARLASEMKPGSAIVTGAAAASGPPPPAGAVEAQETTGGEQGTAGPRERPLFEQQSSPMTIGHTGESGPPPPAGETTVLNAEG